MPLLPIQEFGAAYSNAATPEYPNGSYKDETVPGSSRDGSPLVAVTENDRLGFDYALAAEVGMTFTNTPDTATSSQRLEAHKLLIQNLIDNSDLGDPRNPASYGAVYGTVNDAQRVLNTAALQQCIDASEQIVFTGLLEKNGSNTLVSNREFVGIARQFGVVDYSNDPCFIDATLTASDEQGNNTRDVSFYNMYVRSINSNCFHMTPYQCSWERCFFRANNGYCFKIHDGGYQVENRWVDNYFFDFIIAVEASENGDSRFRKLTDSFFKDNYYYTNANSGSQIALDIYGGSGSLIDGDHYYGDYSVNMVRTFGINVRIVNCYFESMVEPRLYLQAGNPSSVTVSNCAFWGGNGAVLNEDGDPSGLIEVRYSAFNRTHVTFSGNVFEAGSNEVPVFLVRNSNDEDSQYHKVSFDKSNILNGSYSKAAISVTGTATNTWSIQSDHVEFWQYFIADDVNPSFANCSEIFIEDSANAIEYALLPTRSMWLGDKEIIINNIGTSTTLSLQSRAAGDDIVGGNDIEPGGRYRLTRRNMGSGVYTFFLQSLSGVASGGSGLTKYEGITFSFPAGPLAAGAEARALVDIGSGSITDSDLTMIVNLKTLPEGLVMSTYFDSTTDNVWKVKVVNASTASVTIGSYTGNVAILS